MEHIYNFFKRNWAALLYVTSIFSIAVVGVLTSRKNKTYQPLQICIYSTKFKYSNMNSVLIHPFRGKCSTEIRELIFDAELEGTVSIPTEEIIDHPYRFFFHTKNYDFHSKHALK